MSYLLHIKPKSSWHFFDLVELKHFSDLFYILTWRDIKVRFKQTFLGVAWILFQPLVNMIIFTVFFGNFANIPTNSLPYPVFVLLGLVFWGYFSTVLAHAANIFLENESLVKKVYFPREILPLSTVITDFVSFLASLILFFAIAIFFHVSLNFAFIFVLLITTLVTITASIGGGLFLASINIRFRDIKYILPFFLQLLIFVTPVIYPMAIVRPSFQFLLALNPLTGIIDILRTTLVTGSIHFTLIHFVSLVSAIAIFFVGAWYFRNTERTFADML